MKNEQYLKSPMYIDYKEKVKVIIDVPALIYIPGHTIIALCFF